MINMLDVDGLECEEAMMLIRMSLRSSGGQSMRVTSSSVTFHALLTKWAESTGHELKPTGLPAVKGGRWELDIMKQEACHV